MLVTELMPYPVTAKAGRPDTNRAGNESTFTATRIGSAANRYRPVLRTVVEGRIPWRFLPKVSADSPNAQSAAEEANGIWLPGVLGSQAALIQSAVDDDSEHFEESDDETTAADPRDGETLSTSSESEAEGRGPALGVQSRFAALDLAEEDESDDESEESQE